MNHVCKLKREPVCKFRWGEMGGWCGKVVVCPVCNKKLNYCLECKSITSCPHYEPRKWYHLLDGWRPWRCRWEYLT